MQDTITSTTAAHWNSYQLAAILTSCFEGYLTPFTIQGEVFAERFAASRCTKIRLSNQEKIKHFLPTNNDRNIKFLALTGFLLMVIVLKILLF